MKVKYEEHTFYSKSLDLIDAINFIVEDYQKQGYDLSVRQIYYQLVSRGLIENTSTSYDKISNLISNGRLAGLIDWDAVVDRTRFVRQNTHWNNLKEILLAAAESYMTDRWTSQAEYVEVWVEKDALIGIVQDACMPLDVPALACRGYNSQSEMRAAALRMIAHNDKSDRTIIYLGDHDPSGLDMVRDIRERMRLFGANVKVERIALTMDQIERYSPPPNPAKFEDTRAKDYISKYGKVSWELDALDPAVITNLIKKAVLAHTDLSLFKSVEEAEKSDKAKLLRLAHTF